VILLDHVMDRAIVFDEVAGWAADLDVLHARIAPRFARPELRLSAAPRAPQD